VPGGVSGEIHDIASSIGYGEVKISSSRASSPPAVRLAKHLRLQVTFKRKVC
jgi:hypothetical protein